MDFLMTQWDSLMTLVKGNPWNSATIAAVISTIAGSGILSFLRRPKSASQGEAKYFADGKLLTPPTRRPAYSDRMAYVLAEMSALAYYEFEGSGGVVKDAAKHFLGRVSDNSEEIEKLLEQFADELLVKGVDSIEFFRKILENSDFELIGTINVKETQGFVCRRNPSKGASYVVVAFRGTEQKTSDWLTDARAVPKQEGVTKVHTGFHEALLVNEDIDGFTAMQRVEEFLDAPEAKDANGELLPVFITGHSLGGALALLAAKQLGSKIDGASYTYGAPRVANYDYFRGMKTPVFRVVNSSDIVPRVPPGAIMTLIVKLVQGLSWLTSLVPAVSGLLDKLEQKLDMLMGYRHYGDQRYLTDVKSGEWNTVRLLSNPPAIDRLIWMGTQLSTNIFSPVKSHGMKLYRNKLNYIANDRNKASGT